MQALLNVCLAVHAAGLMAWFGTLSARRVFGLVGSPGARIVRIAAALALVSGALWPCLQTALVLDDPAAALAPAQVAAVLGETSFGRTWLVREGMVALAAAGVLLPPLVPLLEAGRAVYFLVAAALASLAMVGHAAAVEGMGGNLQRLALAVHLLAGGAWLGALPLLWQLGRQSAPGSFARLLRRFSGYGMLLVAMVLGTGGLSAAFRLSAGGAGAALASGYGQILALKVLLVAGMGVAALNNRNRLVPALERAAPGSPAAGSTAVPGQLRRSIAVEAFLGIAVVLVATFLGATDPPG